MGMLKTRPNIILVVLDSVRQDHLSCYGYFRQTTPNIDRIAGEGIQCTRAYATSCWTLPSHASLFTGLYPSQHRADFDTRYLDPRHPTIASYLKSLGYETICITCNGFISRDTNLANGFDICVDVERLRGGAGSLRGKVIRYLHRLYRDWRHPDRGAQRATQLALNWLDRSNHDKPFFLFLNFMDCHLPYRLRSPMRYRFTEPGNRRRVDTVPQDPFAYMAGKISLTEQDFGDLQTLYDGGLFYLDYQVGLIEARLRRLGLDEHTILIVTSDHGESFGERGLADHQYGLYEHLLAVPLILRLPGREMAGRVHHGFVQLVDIFPTLTDILDGKEGGGPVPEFAGTSLFAQPQRDVVLAEYLVPNLRAFRRRYPKFDVSRYDVALRAIRTERYKLIRRADGGLELFDLHDDPRERVNLATSRPDLVSRLTARLEEQLGDWPEPSGAQMGEGLDKIRDRLEALGYL